jgi:hypothetical protein
VQDFFMRRLIAQRGASARTVESYRDAFELLLGFAERRTGRPPSALQLADLDAPLVLDFLDYLEAERGNTIRTRNARLAAIHSFMRYAGLRDPASLPITTRVLAIPAKRFDRPVLGYLSASRSPRSWPHPTAVRRRGRRRGEDPTPGRRGRTVTQSGSWAAYAGSASTTSSFTTNNMPARSWQPTSGTLTATVHIRAGTTGHPTTMRAWSCRSTHPYADNVSSAEPSTNTAEQPDHRHETEAQQP